MRVTLTAFILLSYAIVRAQPAATVVTGCQDAQQPGGSNLFDAVARAAVSGLRPVVFDCPPDTIIEMNPAAAIEIRGPVVIDGQDKITIDAPGQRQAMFTVPHGIGASLTLRNIRIRGAQLAPLAAASVVAAHEPLVLENVTIDGTDSPIRAGSDLTVRNSRFTGNTGSVLLIVGPNDPGGAVLIENSQFTANEGPAVNGGRTTTVRASQFVGNVNGIQLSGGTVKGSLFQSNRGAGIVMDALNDIELAGNTFDTNRSGVLVVFTARAGTVVRVRLARNVFSGHTTGAILVSEFALGTPAVGERLAFELLNNRFLHNSAEQNGGGVNTILREMAPLVSMAARGNVFRDNVAGGSGGAIHWNGGPLAISHSLFRGNRATTGGAIFARPAADAPVSVVNTLIVESSGDAIDVPAATILNTTIARNKGRGVVFADAGSSAVIANTIFDRNGEGNCAGVATQVLRRGNIQFGSTDCAGVTVADPNLDHLYVPALTSAAAGAGDRATCSAAPVDGVDLLMQRRGTQHCSSGAYERAPVQAAAQPRRMQSCPDGSLVGIGRPCAAPLTTCPGGQLVPVGTACPCQPHGQMCTLSGQCCNGVPCTSGRCRFP